MTSEPPEVTHSLSGYWIAGALYQDTAAESLEQLAQRLAVDLADVRARGVIHPASRFTVTAVSQTVLETRITGMNRILDPDRSLTRALIGAVFELGSHYNRVNLAFPSRSRFIHQILALQHNGTVYAALVGVMLSDGYPWSDRSPTPGEPTAQPVQPGITDGMTQA